MFTLDQDQYTVVMHDHGPLLVVAGAGSGKTATLTERVARIITEQGVSPERILMLTFSRKAAREMFARLHARLGQPPREAMPIIENFHALGWRLIQHAPERCQRAPGVSLMDEADQKRLMRQAMKDVDLHALRIGTLRSLQEVHANEGLSLHAAGDEAKWLRWMRLLEVPAGQETRVMEALRAYAHAKKRLNVVDFGDLIALPVQGLREHPDWAARLSARFEHLVVDEAQDTNAIQYDLIRLLAPHGNLMLVGDDDQCIYEWRGARPNNMQHFVEEYGARVLRLDRNYRSTPAIVERAALHIAHNTQRMEKHPYAKRHHRGDDPVLAIHGDGEAMAESIARDLRRRLDAGESPRQMAVLYRTNRMAQVLEPALVAYGIPYHVAQGVELFRRQEAQMLMAAVRAVLNPQDEMALHTLAALMDGVGERTMERMFEAARQRNQPLLEGRHFLRGQAQAALNDLARRLELLKLWNPAHIGEWALSAEAGQFGPWLKNLSKGAENPRAAFQKRLNTLISIDQAVKSRLADKGLMGREQREEQWAEVLALGLGTPDEEVDYEAVTLSTIFKVKGLEFRHVHVAGFSEGLMPLVRKSEVLDDDDGPSNLEEERRLSYVAATRARETLHLHHADTIDWGFTVGTYTVSRFAEEMGLAPQWGEGASWNTSPRETRREFLSAFGF